ncbi:hypothetical protein [Acrocarpospora sp. B8E8]|uniref:hypothetical protein n=1 Tax=Acrocarpospora sp. B8E8 TaxID=3153572 RepID=UPI00325CE9A7
MSSQRTLLKVLLTNRHLQSHRAFSIEYNKIASRVDKTLAGTAPSREQFNRWLSGKVKTVPRPEHCRVLERMFPGHSAADLLSAYDPQIVPLGVPRTSHEEEAPTNRRGMFQFGARTMAAEDVGGQANTDRQPVVSSARPHDAMDMEELRRQLLIGIVGLGATAAFTPLDGLERLHTVIDQGLGGPDLADWEERAWEYAHRMVSHPLPQVISDLSVDILALQEIMPKQRATGWARVNAEMMMFLAYALGSAGHIRQSHHWWSSARRAAAAAGDDMVALVASFEAILGLYEPRPLPLILARVDSALKASRGMPCHATTKALGARAHALALMGDREGSFEALDEQARVYKLLPGSITDDEVSVWGWPVQRLLHTRSLVYTLAGYPAAGQAQQDSIAAYAPGRSRHAARQSAQVHLHVATSAVRSGDVSEGLAYARRTLELLGTDDVRASSYTRLRPLSLSCLRTSYEPICPL